MINSDAPSSPSVTLRLPEGGGGTHAQGWGFGLYPEDKQSVAINKDPAARQTQVSVETIADRSNFRSTVFFGKVLGSSKGYGYTEAQPFARSFAGRDWMFMHNGDLDRIELEKLHHRKTAFLEPLGRTDSELAFCNLLSLIYENRARKISDLSPELLHSWFQRFDRLGSADMMLTDGDSVLCFHGSQSPKHLFYRRLQPPHYQDLYECEAMKIVLNDPRDTYRTALMIATSPLSDDIWTPLQPGQMIIAGRGKIMIDSACDNYLPADRTPVNAGGAHTYERKIFQSLMKTEREQSRILNAKAITETPDGKPLSYRLYEVSHATRYEYGEPVEHSTHLFRLQPIDDTIQEVIETRMTLSSPAEEIQFEDVFGNQSVHCTVNAPYQELKLEATSRVKVYATPPDDHGLSRRRTSFPLIWMPWQRQMMTPYLLPPELPESQLIELTEYAMSFVDRNDSHLLQTIEDINLSIYRDYKYVPGVTSLNTTPFEVYTSRQGVCQDFANLFICLARLLSIPARYRMGYIYTGESYENKIQSDASHAWAEVYLPYVGWRGFDPTNGCAAGQDHIRVACGRNYRDATPTSGTIYKGGGRSETLTADVKVINIKS